MMCHLAMKQNTSVNANGRRTISSSSMTQNDPTTVSGTTMTMAEHHTVEVPSHRVVDGEAITVSLHTDTDDNLLFSWCRVRGVSLSDFLALCALLVTPPAPHRFATL
eukprot:TRINITY_DN12992_c0_g1_i1.p3 TRINITY_DN12992_c0_g1~~TRINITY_DN12992_c0_g1_i1.p3  ORF type:complete len:107 (+),score=14.88 TRINITY_DN12992_c0_g1_i1:713-1033(+)